MQKRNLKISHEAVHASIPAETDSKGDDIAVDFTVDKMLLYNG